MKSTLAAFGTTVLLAFAPTQAASEESGIELGLLSCTVEGGFGLLLGSSRDMQCSFTPADSPDVKDLYVGTINKLGLDIGVTGESYVRWLVVAAERDLYKPGELAGTYSGASASATFAVGLGANVLVGGSSEAFALQPFSVQGQTGLNLAAGFAQLKLRSAN